MTARLTTEEFIAKARKVHGDKYDYSLVNYTSATSKIPIACRQHGLFEQTPDAHTRAQGCPMCKAAHRTLTTSEFTKRARRTHGEKYDYSQVEYRRSTQPIRIICNTHGPFHQTPTSHLQGDGCPACGGKQHIDTTQFVTKATIAHTGRYSYENTVYVNTYTKVSITCREHGKFLQKPNNHLSGQGCPRCAQQNYSMVAVRWLDETAKEQNINIQHAENGGEFRIPGTRMKADGYCVETNTIYEFHGDVYHGNPLIYNKADLCHPFNKNTTAGELHQRTLAREEKIRSLGYNLVVLWESVVGRST